jgi:lipopolysaccharide biosynthesis regulator YciM
VNVERLTETGSRLGRHLARVQADLRQADRLRGSQRETVLRGAARQFMQAGFHDLARDVRRQAREVQK